MVSVRARVTGIKRGRSGRREREQGKLGNWLGNHQLQRRERWAWVMWSKKSWDRLGLETSACT